MTMLWLFWTALIALFTTLLFYVAHTWWQVGGLRGMALLLLVVAMLVKAWVALQLQSCTEQVERGALLLYSCATLIPLDVLTAMQFSADLVKAISILLLIDLYRSSHNSHRAWSTRAYVWFQRVAEVDRRQERQSVLNGRNEA